jgi:hypothetical protein
LNFHTRIKQPSIKNFQLVAATADPQPTQQHGHRPQLLLQFGKVSCDTYVLDFSPSALTTLQAFALALSNFERKYSSLFSDDD